MSLKCKPGRLVMSDAVPYGQRWTYASTDPMSEMTKPEYYANVADNLRAGDSIRIMRVDREDVLEIGEYLVAAKDGLSINLFELSKPVKVPQSKGRKPVAPKVRTLKVEEGKGCAYLIDEEGKIVGEFADAGEARKAKPELERAA